MLVPVAVLSAPAGPPSGLDVKIVSPLPVPVTVEGDANVTGDVNVTNTPDVNVANTPDVNVVKEPVYEIVQVRRETNYGDRWVELYDVPNDKFLEIEYVSIRVYSKDLHVTDVFLEIINSDNTSIRHYLNPPEIRPDSASGDYYEATGGQITKIYAGPGKKVKGYAGIWTSYPYWQGFITISGQLKPLN